MGKPFPLGNVYGRMGAPVTDALRRAAMSQDQAKLRRACEAALTQAARGSLAHLAWIADRLDGRAIARVEHVDSDARELDLAAVMRAVMSARAAGAEDALALDDPAASLDPPIPQIGEAGGVVEAEASPTIAAKNEKPE